jgi:hypothetical protein
MFPSKTKSKGKMSSSFINKNSPKGSLKDDNKSDMTNADKLKSVKHPRFDSHQF